MVLILKFYLDILITLACLLILLRQGEVRKESTDETALPLGYRRVRGDGLKLALIGMMALVCFITLSVQCDLRVL